MSFSILNGFSSTASEWYQYHFVRLVLAAMYKTNAGTLSPWIYQLKYPYTLTGVSSTPQYCYKQDSTILVSNVLDQ